MAVKKIKYFVTVFYPDEKGFFELPEGSIAVYIKDKGHNTYVRALVPIRDSNGN